MDEAQATARIGSVEIPHTRSLGVPISLPRFPDSCHDNLPETHDALALNIQYWRLSSVDRMKMNACPIIEQGLRRSVHHDGLHAVSARNHVGCERGNSEHIGQRTNFS